MTTPASRQYQADIPPASDTPVDTQVPTNERLQSHVTALSTQSSSRHTSLGTSTFTSSTTNDKTLNTHEQGADATTSNNSTIDIALCEIPSRDRSGPTLPILLAYVALCVSIFLVALDTVLIPTALPTISLSFHIPDSLYAWIGSAYLLANAASVPLWGKLADVFGRKNIILASNFVFLGGSVVCATSVSAAMLVAGRSVQGMGGGGVVVLVHVCVSDLFDICDRSFYLGTVGAVWAVASALGPVLGGVFTQNLSWRWCFYINLPIVAFSIVILYFTLHLHDPRTPILSGLLSIDWIGVFTILTATILLLVGLQTGGPTAFSSPLVITFLVLAGLAYILFPFTQWREGKRGGSPIMPLRIFRDPSSLSALSVCACDALVFNSVAYFLPLYFQIVLGKSPSSSGLYMLALAIPLAIVSLTSGHVIERTGRLLEVLQAGLFLMTVGIGLLISLDSKPYLGKVIGFMIVIGLGFGPNFSAPLIALQTRIRSSDIAAGTAAFGFVRMVSGAIGVVVGQVIFQMLMKPQQDIIVEAGVSRAFAELLTGGESISQVHSVSQLSKIQRDVVRLGFMKALRGTWVFYTVVSALGLFVSFGIKRTKLSRDARPISEENSVEQAAGSKNQRSSAGEEASVVQEK